MLKSEDILNESDHLNKYCYLKGFVWGFSALLQSKERGRRCPII